MSLKFDWIRFLTTQGIDYKDHGVGISTGWIGLQCPHHHSTEGKYLLGIHLESGVISCWSCGPHKLLDTIKALASCSHEQAFQYLKEFSSESVAQAKGRSFYATGGVDYISLPGSNFTPKELSYMESRMIDEERRSRFDIRSGGRYDPIWRFRIVLPMVDGGRIVCATGRSIIKSCELRYYTLPPEKSIKHNKALLYGGHLINPKKPVVVLEGPLDVVRYNGNAVATMGTAVSDMQLLRLSSYDNVIVLLDKDEAADKKREEIANKIGMLSNTKVEFAEYTDEFHHKDVGDLPDNILITLKKELE